MLKTPETKRLVIISVSRDESDSELESFMQDMASVRQDKTPAHIICLLECDDKREVWECPECKTTCKRLVDCGFISFLNPIVSLTEGPTFDPRLVGGLGAFEVWKISKGTMGGRNEYYDQESFFKLWDEFLEVLGTTNEKAKRFFKDANG